jgi:hypothetical protein
MLRARILVSMERLFTPEDRHRPGHFPPYYFVMVPLGDGRMSGLTTVDQWDDLLNSLKCEIRDTQQRVEKKITQVEEMIEVKVGNVEKEIQQVHEKMTALIEQQEQLFRRLDSKR